MKKLILLILSTIIIASWVFSQRNLVFEYDASGNCIVKYKTVILPAQSKQAKAPTDDQENIPEEPQIEDLGDYKIYIYPNPTYGELKIEIIGSRTEIPYQILLFDMNGKLLVNQEISGNIFNLNMTRFQTGNYILRMIIEDKKFEWKIIKQ